MANSLISSREKTKWQIALRRYVLEKHSSAFYAPYFGLDIENMRKWFEHQFSSDLNWMTFATKWHFEHIIPTVYFDFASEPELRMCWNFMNLKVGLVQRESNKSQKRNILVLRTYFENLCCEANYTLCNKFLKKIESIEAAEQLSYHTQKSFLLANQAYLQEIDGFSALEFELLNEGRTISEVQREVEIFKKLAGQRL